MEPLTLLAQRVVAITACLECGESRNQLLGVQCGPCLSDRVLLCECSEIQHVRGIWCGERATHFDHTIDRIGENAKRDRMGPKRSGVGGLRFEAYMGLNPGLLNPGSACPGILSVLRDGAESKDSDPLVLEDAFL